MPFNRFYQQFRSARLWSNRELKKIAPLFRGDVVNVSGWEDDDKEGGKYSNYFTGKNSYRVTNYKGMRGFGGTGEEIFLDLEEKIPDRLRSKFDVVFNHTTLEHIFDVTTAFSNLCSLTRDVLIIVVPFVQVMHAAKDKSYLDYWRFTPHSLRRLFEANNLKLIYLSANDRSESIYLFAVGSRHPRRWIRKLGEYDKSIFERLG